MKAVMIGMLVLVMASMAGAATVTERVDLLDGKTVTSTYVQGLAGGLELWAFNQNTETPTYRIGMVRPVSSHLKLGCYIAKKEAKTDQVWIDPRFNYSNKAGSGKTQVVVDWYQPMDTETKKVLNLCDSSLTFPLTKTVAVGIGLNGSWTEGKNAWAKGEWHVKVQLGSVPLYFRDNFIGGGAPDSWRLEAGVIKF